MKQRQYGFDPVCSICGDRESVTYYMWHKDDEYKDKVLCNKHYSQLRNNKKIIDPKPSKHSKRNYWTEDEKQKLEELYKDGKSFKEISEIMNRSIGSVNSMSGELNLGDKYMRHNNPKFKAIYQDYDWCYERYINRRMSLEEMAEEAGCSLRVLKKWCVEKHRIHRNSFKQLKKMTEQQYKLIEVGILGDGHIDKREDQPMYIESHTIEEKDYLFYKYNILKDLCNKEPVYHDGGYYSFSTDNEYLCKPFYRFNTKIINELKSIRNKNRVEIISNLNEWQVSLLFLDDGHRANLWQLCVAEWSEEQVSALLNRLLEFNIRGKIQKDERYISFDAYSSKNLDEMILNNIPNELDIVHKKIIDNSKIKKYQNNFYVLTDNGKIGLRKYCKQNKYMYLMVKFKIDEMSFDFPEIEELDFIKMMEPYKIGA